MVLVDKSVKEDFNKSIVNANDINENVDVDTTELNAKYNVVKERNYQNEKDIKTFLCRLSILDMFSNHWEI